MAFCPSRVRLGGWYGIIVLLCVRYIVAPVWGAVYTVHVPVLLLLRCHVMNVVEGLALAVLPRTLPPSRSPIRRKYPLSPPGGVLTVLISG